jgi:hypothetical protein
MSGDHFLEKKDMIFPWPVLGAAFFGFAAGAELVGLDFEIGGGGGASSSEKDSQPGSWMVTARAG